MLDSQLGYRAFLLRQAFPNWFPLIVYTIVTRQTNDHRGSHDDYGEAEQYPEGFAGTEPRGRDLRDVRDRDARLDSVVNSRHAVAHRDSGLIENHARAVGPGQAYHAGVLGGDQVQRADFLLNVPARARGEIAEQERAGDSSAKHV